MPRNIELKARIPSIASLSPRGAALATQGPTEIFQDDTFFPCPAGRLKLRAFSETTGELIFYRRPDHLGPKESFYLRSPTHDPASLRELLTLAYGVAGRVIKHRTLYLVGRTRVHLDRVQNLGEFLELEVMLGNDEPPDSAMHEALHLMTRLGIDNTQLVEGAYMDLLIAQKG
ncbi:MAG: class IV adenylate cyclase [Phycisphaeraceae bacterium]|nr:class IV adenylate cyclase [Phycisphaeraceae bacterium]